MKYQAFANHLISTRKTDDNVVYFSNEETKDLMGY